LENHFIGNQETHALHIDATFQNFVQGDLNMNDYCLKMKGFADSLIDLGVDVLDCVFILNILCRLNKNFDHLRAIFMHTMSFTSFQKVHNDLCLEEIQQDAQGLQSAATAPTVFYAAPKPPLMPTSSDGLVRPPRQQQQQQRLSQESNKKKNYNNRGNHGCNGADGGNDDGGSSGNGKDQGANAPWPSFFNPWTGSIQMWLGPEGLRQQAP
jgi:hypothetical protein